MHFLNLKVFCDLVDTGSFSTAADRNDITQSAVSQQIQTLEQRFGMVFFERGKMNFSITPEGTVFHAAALRMLEIYRNIDAELHAVRNEVEGLSAFDGTPYQYFHDGPRGYHAAWDSRCFD